MRLLLIVLFVLLLTACASTPDQITAVQGPRITNQTLVEDLQGASWNLDQAIAVGALPKDDPAAACLHDVLTKAGIDPTAPATPAASFAPRKEGLASAASIAYILKRQAEQYARTRVPVSVDCKALVGQIVIDSASAVRRVLPAVIGGR